MEFFIALHRRLPSSSSTCDDEKQRKKWIFIEMLLKVTLMKNLWIYYAIVTVALAAVLNFFYSASGVCFSVVHVWRRAIDPCAAVKVIKIPRSTWQPFTEQKGRIVAFTAQLNPSNYCFIADIILTFFIDPPPLLLRHFTKEKFKSFDSASDTQFNISSFYVTLVVDRTHWPELFDKIV